MPFPPIIFPYLTLPVSPALCPLQPGHERYRLSAELSRLLKLPREEKASRLQTALLDLVRSRELFALPAPVPAEMVASTGVVAYILCDPDLQKLVGLQKVHLAALIPRLTQQGTPTDGERPCIGPVCEEWVLTLDGIVWCAMCPCLDRPPVAARARADRLHHRRGEWAQGGGPACGGAY